MFRGSSAMRSCQSSSVMYNLLIFFSQYYLASFALPVLIGVDEEEVVVVRDSRSQIGDEL